MTSPKTSRDSMAASSLTKYMSVAGAVDELGRRGFTEGLRVINGGLRAIGTGEPIRTEDLVIREVYRFEGVSDPDDMVRSRAKWHAHPQGAAVAGLPLLEIVKIGEAPPEPAGNGPRALSGLRVLDLTRVIAGPVCGRTLASFGAEVLVVSSPHLPNLPGLVIDTGFGKLSTSLDMTKIAVPRRRDESGAWHDVKVPEHVDILATLKSGAVAHLRFSAITGLSPAPQAWIFGSEGTLRIEADAKRLSGGRRGDKELREIPIPAEKRVGWRVEEEFVNAIRGREKVTHTNFEDGVRYMEFTDAVTKSAQSGQAVDVAEL